MLPILKHSHQVNFDFYWKRYFKNEFYFQEKYKSTQPIHTHKKNVHLFKWQSVCRVCILLKIERVNSLNRPTQGLKTKRTNNNKKLTKNTLKSEINKTFYGCVFVFFFIQQLAFFSFLFVFFELIFIFICFVFVNFYLVPTPGYISIPYRA